MNDNFFKSVIWYRINDLCLKIKKLKNDNEDIEKINEVLKQLDFNLDLEAKLDPDQERFIH